MPGELDLELGVGLGLVPDALELLQRAHKGLRHVLAAESAKPAGNRMLNQVGLPPHSWGGRREAAGGESHSSRENLSKADVMDEGPNLVQIFHPHRGLDPARNIDAVGLEGAHDLAHVTRFETAGDEYLPGRQQIAGEVPIPCAAGAAPLV